MATAKVVVIGDPHFRIDNIEEVNLFIKKIKELVDKEKPDLVVCLGDLLHTHERLHTIPLNKAYEFIKALCDYKLYILVGNHDYIQNQQFLTQNHWMNGLKEWPNVTIVDCVKSVYINHIFFTFCPYVPNGRFKEALDTAGYNWMNSVCIFAHQEFYGCKMGAIVSVEGDKWPETNPFVISGHIHSKQRPQPNIYYTGSALQHAFGESEENTISIVEFGENETIREVDLGLPRKKIVYTDIGDPNLLSKIKEKITEQPDQHIKLTLSGDDYGDFKAFKKSDVYKQLIDTGTKVVFKSKDAGQKFTSATTSPETNFDFKKILYDSVSSNTDLMEMYNLIVNGEETIILTF